MHFYDDEDRPLEEIASYREDRVDTSNIPLAVKCLGITTLSHYINI